MLSRIYLLPPQATPMQYPWYHRYGEWSLKKIRKPISVTIFSYTLYSDVWCIKVATFRLAGEEIDMIVATGRSSEHHAVWVKCCR